jgi:autotransporter-associated beta strand protein
VVGTLSTIDPDASNTFTYTLATGTGSTDNAAFNISGNQVRATASLDFETKSSYSVRIRSTDQDGLFTEKAFTITVIDVNEAPTAVLLSPAARSLPDSTSTAERFKLADITLTDDGLGTNSLSLSGSDAGSFEIMGTELFLRAGVKLDGLSKPAYAVTVEASDATLPGSPQSAVFSLSVVTSGIEVADGQSVADTTVRSGDFRLVKRGAGALILDLANTHSGGTVVEAGEVVVRNPLALSSGSLIVQAGAKVTLEIGTRRVSLPAMTVAGSGTLDLGTGSVAISVGRLRSGGASWPDRVRPEQRRLDRIGNHEPKRPRCGIPGGRLPCSARR